MCKKCEGCGCELSAENIEVDGDLYCAGCAFVCCDCGDAFLIAERIESDGGDEYCGDCYGNNFCHCDACDCELSVDDVQCADNGSVYCESCHDTRYTVCQACGDEISRNDSYNDVHGDPYCEHCYNERYSSCYDCGREIFIYNGDYHSDDDGIYCERCWRNGHGDNWEPRKVPVGVRFERIKSARRFGIELETHQCDGYESIRDKSVFGAKDDGSIDGKEFISPPMSGDEGLEHVETFCRLARSWEVDKCCGFHVHLDMTGETLDALKSIVTAYAATEDVWSLFVAGSRRENSYCARLDHDPSDLLHLCSLAEFGRFASGVSRYMWFNIAAYNGHRTFEIRLHGGTLDVRKITNWVKAHVRFADWASSRSREDIRRAFRGTVQDRFAKLAEIWQDKELADFYAARAEKFGTVVREPAIV